MGKIKGLHQFFKNGISAIVQRGFDEEKVKFRLTKSHRNDLKNSNEKNSLIFIFYNDIKL